MIRCLRKGPEELYTFKLHGRDQIHFCRDYCKGLEHMTDAFSAVEASETMPWA